MKKEDLRPVEYVQTNLAELTTLLFEKKTIKDLSKDRFIKGWFHTYDNKNDIGAYSDAKYALIEKDEDGTMVRIDPSHIRFLDKVVEPVEGGTRKLL